MNASAASISSAVNSIKGYKIHNREWKEKEQLSTAVARQILRSFCRKIFRWPDFL